MGSHVLFVRSAQRRDDDDQDALVRSSMLEQPYRYTTYERDGDGVDQAMMRSYHGWHSRFDQPDLWDGSYDLTDPQSFNRYSYVQNDPVNYVDPSGLFALNREYFEAMEALWELWLFGMQMNQRLLPPLIDGPPELPAVTPPQVDTSKLGEPPSTEPQRLPLLHCQQNIINAMRQAWMRAGNGARKTEAGFITYRGRDGQIGTVNLPNTNQERRISFRLSDVLPQGATLIAIFHTHPNSSSAMPSTGDPPSDVATANRLRVPIYVISNRGLNVYDPATRQTTELRANLDWQRPCRE